MRNYRRYGAEYGRQPVRGGQKPDRNRLVVIGLIAVVVILFGLYLRTGKRNTPANENANTSTLVNTNAFSLTPTGPALTTVDCTAVVSRGTTTEKVIALTYDVGTKPGDVDKTVPVVKAANVPAAFFVPGKLAETERASVELIRDAGFPVYNHSYDNLRFPTLTAQEITAQLESTESFISGITNTTTKPYMRLPAGASNAAVIEAVRAAGYCPLTWTVDGLDIQSDATATSVVTRVMRFVEPGAIILLHAGSDLAATVTPQIVSQAQAEGFRFVSLDELFRLGKPAGAVTNTNTTPTSNGNASASERSVNTTQPA
ncbi:MAG: polysaccharide deacetylase family protein [Patescibacteria group bacterium]|jgi:peptidoglycan/xylan/chitin deacetylase (PgdA/CDA1 family)